MDTKRPLASKLKGKKVVVKFGGSSIGGAAELEQFAQDISFLVSLGIRPIVVHGGGPEINDELKRRGLAVKKIAGLRITDDATLEVAADVLCAINHQIVEALEGAGLKVVGMAGAECDTVRCKKIAPTNAKDENGKEVSVDLGNVGEIIRVDPARLNLLAASGFVPVIYPICSAGKGVIMNVNADTMAAHIAKAVRSQELILVTDVPGIMRVFGKEETIIRRATVDEIDALIADGIVSGGMIPKVEACMIAVKGGVARAHMVCGRQKSVIVDALLSDEAHGTVITR
ncbi:MAG: acetylglutamate kinase [Methanomassiliicoccales archaeon]|nr:acetylglutamate kinase [Methanomassiliicoccales archaeon]